MRRSREFAFPMPNCISERVPPNLMKLQTMVVGMNSEDICKSRCACLLNASPHYAQSIGGGCRFPPHCLDYPFRDFATSNCWKTLPPRSINLINPELWNPLDPGTPSSFSSRQAKISAIYPGSSDIWYWTSFQYYGLFMKRSVQFCNLLQRYLHVEDPERTKSSVCR